MSMKMLAAAMLTAFGVAVAAPAFSQNQQGNQGQTTPGASPSNNTVTGTQTPQQKSKKKRQSGDSSGQSNQSDQSNSAHPGNSNQTGVPNTQPGGTGTQSGSNPAGSPSSSTGTSSGTSR